MNPSSYDAWKTSAPGPVARDAWHDTRVQAALPSHCPTCRWPVTRAHVDVRERCTDGVQVWCDGDPDAAGPCDTLLAECACACRDCVAQGKADRRAE